MARQRRGRRTKQEEDDERTAGELLGDFQTASELQAALLAFAPSTGLRVDVDAEEGVVYLRGEVASAWQKERAEQIVRAARLSGVKRVRNELVVNPALPPLVRP
ncbi:MAG: BON domain-containing protein [Actinobacteria bacterium]|nr:BON domain-containing protein [Actinomycetota bacterium]